MAEYTVPGEGDPKMVARRRLLKALTNDHAETCLSDVFFDAHSQEDWGYDCDDLAAILLPILQDAFIHRGLSFDGGDT